MLPIHYCTTKSNHGRSTGRKSESVPTVLKSGIDFPGPFCERSGGKQKIYISLFVSTHGIGDNSHKRRLPFAITRFISRRGMPEKILTDNGTNFSGARSDLIKLKALLDKDDTRNSFVNFANERNCE